jgi:hypothetical protein
LIFDIFDLCWFFSDDKVQFSDEGHELSKLIRDSGKTRLSNVTSEEVAAMRKKAQTNNCKCMLLLIDLFNNKKYCILFVKVHFSL